MSRDQSWILPSLVNDPNRASLSLPISSRKSERAEKLCLARPFWMIKGKEVIAYLALLNKSIICIRKVHSPDPRSWCGWWRAESWPNAQAHRPPPKTFGRLQQSLTNYPNRPTALRGGGSLQRPGSEIPAM
jgi:hypothetical protein